MKKIRAAVILLILIWLIIASFYEYQKQQQTAKLLTGTVEVTKADITAKTSGYIKNLHIKEGDTVHKGDIAAELDRKDLEAALLRDKAAYSQSQAKLTELENGTRQEELDEAAAKTAAAKTAYDKAQRDFDRDAALLHSDAIAKSAYDDAASARDSAAAQLQAVQEQEHLLQNGTRVEELQAARDEVDQNKAVIDMSQSAVNDLTIYSPLNGFILTKNFEPGEYVTAGSPIATVADLSDCWVKVYVSSDELGKLKLGQAATVMIDSFPGQKFSGHIRDISNNAEYTPRQSITKDERAHLVFAVKVAIDNGENIMKPGMPADVIFNE